MFRSLGTSYRPINATVCSWYTECCTDFETGWRISYIHRYKQIKSNILLNYPVGLRIILQTTSILFFVSFVPTKNAFIFFPSWINFSLDQRILFDIVLSGTIWQRNLFIPDIFNIIVIIVVIYRFSFLTFFQKFQMTNVWNGVLRYWIIFIFWSLFH